MVICGYYVIIIKYGPMKEKEGFIRLILPLSTVKTEREIIYCPIMNCLNFQRSSLRSNVQEKEFQVEETVSPISLFLVIHVDTSTLWVQRLQEKTRHPPTCLIHNKVISCSLKLFCEM